MSENSRFIQLTSYCLVEYIYADPASPTTSAKFSLIENKHVNTHQIFNDNGDINRTKNVQDLTVIPIGNNQYAYIDQEMVPDYITYDTMLTRTYLNGNAPITFVYDTVRFHFLRGFSFSEFNAQVLTVKNQENNGSYNIFASIILFQSTIDSLMYFDPRPIFLGDIQYDRYIEVKVPSIKRINTDYYATPVSTRNTTFGAQITPNATGGYVGLISNAPIMLSIDECNRVDTIRTNTTQYSVFITDSHNEAVLPQVNEFDLLGASIAESIDGDYVEYYAMYDGGFISDFIAQLRNRNPNDNWVVVHQLQVYEQIGSEFNLVDTVLSYQDDNFDLPKLFRPILKNADSAISFSIDYMIRLVNQHNGDQVIRTASFSSMSPSKYGQYMMRIPLSGTPRSHRIYNKIFKNTADVSKLFSDPDFDGGSMVLSESAVPGQNVVYIPVFFNYNKITVSNIVTNTSTVNAQTATQTNIVDDLIYKQGELHIVITPFDNHLKFKIYETSNKGMAPLDLNASNIFSIVFFNSTRAKVVIQSTKDVSDDQDYITTTSDDLKNGEISFVMQKNISEKLVSSTNRDFHITVTNAAGTETVMYSGFWNLHGEKDLFDTNLRKVKDDRAYESGIVTNIQGIADSMVATNVTSVPSVTISVPGYVGPATSVNETSFVKKITPLSLANGGGLTAQGTA